ncbi:MAG: methyltransferase domain-containing protein [Caulobacteraceae bacterium]
MDFCHEPRRPTASDARPRPTRSATPIQQAVAARLAEGILASAPAAGARVAEFGCGTGYLGRALAPGLAPDLWIATDIAPAMARAARAVTPLAAVMDAGRPALAPGFDLVCSSLTLQWMAIPKRRFRPGAPWSGPAGASRSPPCSTAVSTNGAGAWRKPGSSRRAPRFPSFDEARAWFGPDAALETLTLTERHPSALHFLRSLRAAGADAADTPPLDGGDHAPGHAPVREEGRRGDL